MCRVAHNAEVNHENVLKNLRAQISEFVDIRTGSGHFADITDKTFTALGDSEAILLECGNRPRRLHALGWSYSHMYACGR